MPTTPIANDTQQENKVTSPNEPQTDSKKDESEFIKMSIATKTEDPISTKIKEDTPKESNEIIDLTNFDPKKDKKKLTKLLRKEILKQEKKYQQGTIFIKDAIAPSSMNITPKTLKIGDFYLRSYIIYNYPRYLDPNWLSQVINADVTVDISIFTYPTKSDRIMRILRKKVTEMMSSRNMNAKKGVVNDVSLDTALEDAEQLRVDLQKGTEKFFQMGLYFSILGKTEEDVQMNAEKIQTLLSGQLIMSRPADFQTERAFNSIVPQGNDELQVFRNMNTSPLSTSFPFVSADLTSNKGILYGINRHNNSLIIFDRFNLENANSVIFSKSGSGKSYTTKLEILRSLMVGDDVIVIDPENEYESLCQTVGGSYARISVNSKYRINPFDLTKPSKGQEDEYNSQDAIRENIIHITGLLNIMLGKLTPEEDGMVDKALKQCYEIHGITDNTDKPYEYKMPTMKDLQNILESYEGGQNLSIRIQKYTEGSFAGLFSDQTNTDLSTGLICFCIRDLEDALRPIAMYVLLNFIWTRVRSELRKRILVIDEAWNIMQHEDSGRFLHNLVKRSRKYYLGITTITQDVEDFMRSEWGKPIITNSSLQILLRQSPSSVELLTKTFNLTEGEQYILLNSEVGQGLFFAGNNHVAIQVIASNGEHQIITTNPEDIIHQNNTANY